VLTASSDLIGLVAPGSATLYWYIVRGSGFVAYLLLTTGLVAGLLLSLRWRTNTWPRVLTEDVHQFLQLLALTFLAVHVASTLLDTFVHFTWYQVLIPFTRAYRVLWLGTGIIAMYLAVALALSIYVRRLIGYRVWRTLHYTGFAAWLLALGHGLATGSDTRATWAIVVYLATVLMVIGLLMVRFGGAPLRLGQPPRSRPAVLAALATALLLGMMVTLEGPLQRGWAARAGSIPQVATQPRVPGAPFREVLSGIARPYNAYNLSPGYHMLTLEMDGTGRYPVQLSYRVLVKTVAARIRFVRGLFSLSSPAVNGPCAGTVKFRPPDQLISMCRPTARHSLRIGAHVRIDIMLRVAGNALISSEPYTPGSPISGG